MGRRQRDKRSFPEPLGAILERSGESRFARVRPAVQPFLWREAVGARIADRAFPVSLSGGVLLLRVPSSAWAHELSLLTAEVCQRLRERGVDARELRFRVGAVPPVDRPPERRISRAVPILQSIPPEVSVVLRAVGDVTLRDSIAQAAAANLAWQSGARRAPQEAITEARRAARAPRDAAGESAPQAPGSPASREGGRHTRGGAPDRRR